MPPSKPYSLLAVTFFLKGGGKPPHSKVGWQRIGCKRYAIDSRERKIKAPPFAKSAKDGAP